MKTYNVKYLKEYDVYIDDEIKHFKEHGETEIKAKNKEDAIDRFYESLDKRADVLLCQMNVTVVVEEVQNIISWQDDTKQKILKDFLKKC